MKTNIETTPQIFTSNGIEYITLPAALKYTGIERSTLHQRITRKVIPNIIQQYRYVFIPFEYCSAIRKEREKLNLLKKMERLQLSEIPFEEIEKLIETKSNKMNHEK